MAAYNTAFGSLPGYNEMLGKSNTTGGGVQQQTPGAQRPRRIRPPGQAQEGYQTEQTQPRQTFAQMQQQGQARPAPPMGGQPMGGQSPTGMAPSGGYGGFGRTPQAQDLQGQLQRSLSQGLAQPSAYNTDTFNQLRASQAANLQAEYTGQKQALDEELAARGLYASSIGGGRMGDLAGQQARAMSSLDAQLLQQFATTQAADRLAAQRAAQEYATQQQTTALKAGELTGTFGGQDTLAAREMANQKALQEAALTGQYGGQQTLAGQQQSEQQRQFNVQQQLAQTLGLGNLGLEQQKVAQQGQQFAANLSEQQAARMQQGGFTSQELGLKAQQLQQDAALQGRQMSIAEAQNQAINALEQQKLTQQGQQFAAGQSESARQFNVQQALASQLGLGNLGVAQQEVGIKQQALSQQAADAAAERSLREAMQSRELTAQEKTQLNDITARKELQTQQIGATQAESAAERDIRLRLQSGQITAEQAQQERQIAAQQALQSQQIGATSAESALERSLRERLQTGQITAEQAQQERGIAAQQALQSGQIASQEKLAANQLIEQGRQFGLQLDETKANRLQQYGISTQELGIKAQALQQEAALQGRQMNITEAQNAAQNALERDRITNQAQQFGLSLNETQTARIQQYGLSTQELALKTQQVADDARLRGQSLSQEQAQNIAINGLETQRIQNQASQFTASQKQQMAQFLSQETGNQYGVDANGNIVNLYTGQDSLNKQRVGIERTSAEAQQQLANSQMFMQLAQILSSLTQGTNTANLSDAMGAQLGLVKDSSGKWVPKSALK